MKDIIKQLIIDFQEAEIPQPSPRAYEIITLPANVRKAIIYTGMRRCGKTWVMYDFMHQLINKGLAKEKILYLDFTDDRLEGMKAQELRYIVDAYFELNPNLLVDNNVYFFFDEIHEVEGFENFIRRLLDKGKMHIHITGSSAKMLSKEISTLLRGRTIDQKIFPFDFFEYLRNKQIEIKTPYSSATRYKLQHEILGYITVGGFPEVTLMAPQQRIEVLQGYINSVVYKDIIERYAIKNVHAVKATIHHCIKNAASLLSVNKIYTRLKSQGIEISKDSLYDYLGYFEDSYCIFSIPLLTPSLNKQQINPKKIYPVDTGLITAYSFSNTMNMAAKLETLVFMTLLRNKANIHYYLTKDRLEVDFATIDKIGDLLLIQVCVDLNNQATEEREVKALIQAMQEREVALGYIVTLDTNRTIELENGTIKVIPVLDFISNAHEFF